MTTIKVVRGDDLTIELPDLTAVRIDAERRIIAIDGISGTNLSEERGPDWRVLDLRDGTYGGFHRLLPAGECIDVDCIRDGEHDVWTGHPEDGGGDQ